MCTAVSFRSGDSYFGRNLDLEKSYGECVVITPRNYKLNMRTLPMTERHYAMIGMAIVVGDYPLYYEATNEMGLSMAGLNFPGNAHYKPFDDTKDNVTPFELIPYILGKCKDIREVKRELEKINLVKINFSEELPLSPLHWMISDKETSITVESVKEGLKVYDNPFGVLTNNPTFDYHLMNINNYMSLHEGFADNRISPERELSNYSLGMGALGLPGDYSSASRFVRAVFIKEKSPSCENEKESVSQFFHILGGVAMPKGCVMTRDGEYEYTRYSSCCNADKGIYYYTTYNNSSVTAVDMHSVDLDGRELYKSEIID
ncbi:MAG: choloylglycine hydrolase [Clostridia bacterium]|nr:choloylglycine hydrolase [Clostridia bacterium]